MDLSIHSTVLSGPSSQQQRVLFPFARRCVFVSRRIIVASSDNGTGTVANRYDRLIYITVQKIELIYTADLIMQLADALLIKNTYDDLITF